MKSFDWLKKFSNSIHGSKSAILEIFQTGLGWPCTVNAPSRIPHRISKILFALGAVEFLAKIRDKIREAPFFKVQSGKIKVCNGCPRVKRGRVRVPTERVHKSLPF